MIPVAVRAIVAALVAVGSLGWSGGSATAATSYRYWTYWVGAGTEWTYSPVGPASDVPADGTVQGWRFAVTEGARGQGQSPRLGVAQAFAQFCGDTPPTAGRKRVAVVLDFGDPDDAPPGQRPPSARGTCVVTEPAATGARILSAAAQVRTDRGLVCAIAGYPTGECAPAVAASPATSPNTREQAEPRSRQTTERRATSPPATGATPQPSRASRSSGESRPSDVPPTSASTPRSAAASTGADEPEPTAKARTQDPTSAPSSPATSGTPAPSESAQAGVGTGQPPTTAPVFVEATSLDSSTDSGPPGWLPVVATAGVLAAIGGVITWRRRATRPPKW